VILDGDRSVKTPLYEMTFSQVGVKMPDHLRIGQFEALGTDVCNREGLIGVAVFPAVDAIAGNQGDAVRSTVVDELAGPVVVKMHVTYEIDYKCPGPQTLKGETIFTFFPYGRIVRNDFNLIPSTTKLSESATCGCSTEGQVPLFFTTYYAFEQSGAMQTFGNGTTIVDNNPGACTLYLGRNIGIAVNFAGTNTRYRPNSASAHVFDFVRGEPTIDTNPQSMISAIQIGNSITQASQCQDLLDLLEDAPVSFGGDQAIRTADDGIYRDLKTRTSAFDITAPEGVPNGWVVSVDMGGATHATITHTPEDDTDEVLVQREPDGRFLFSFKNGLSTTDKITIEPRF